MSKKGGRNQPVQPASQQSQHRQAQTTAQILAASQSWQGPLPSPQDLARFNDVMPGLAERIVKMAEDEGAHARRVQLWAVVTASASQILGQIFALAVAAGGLYSAYLLALANHDGVAMVVGGATITTIVGAFLQSRRASKAAK